MVHTYAGNVSWHPGQTQAAFARCLWWLYAVPGDVPREPLALCHWFTGKESRALRRKERLLTTSSVYVTASNVWRADIKLYEMSLMSLHLRATRLPPMDHSCEQDGLRKETICMTKSGQRYADLRCGRCCWPSGFASSVAYQLRPNPPLSGSRPNPWTALQCGPGGALRGARAARISRRERYCLRGRRRAREGGQPHPYAPESVEL